MTDEAPAASEAPAPVRSSPTPSLDKAAPGEPRPEDVTDSFEDDTLDKGKYRIYLTAKGRMIKVMTLMRPRSALEPVGRVMLQITGSDVGEDGKAIDHGNGLLISEAHLVTLQSDGPVDIAAAIEEARLFCVSKTEKAVDNLFAVAKLPGVKLDL